MALIKSTLKGVGVPYVLALTTFIEGSTERHHAVDNEGNAYTTSDITTGLNIAGVLTSSYTNSQVTISAIADLKVVYASGNNISTATTTTVSAGQTLTFTDNTIAYIQVA